MLLGIVATAVMDILSTLARRAHLVTALSPALIGRWAAYIIRAQPRHANIEIAAPVAHELAIAFLAHYAVGVVFATLYIAASLSLGISPRNGIPALTFGLVSAACPWLLMFPAMGFGLFGLHGPADASLFFSSLIGHAAFGLGLWLGALAIL